VAVLTIAGTVSCCPISEPGTLSVSAGLIPPDQFGDRPARIRVIPVNLEPAPFESLPPASA
jgi:hypothetical protein